MIKQIRTHKLSKIIASYLAIQLVVTTVQPTQVFALTSGPSQPEFNSFTPIGTSDMVNLSSGDFNYNIPIMDVGGYPLNLAYDSGVSMDQESSWVGLGWNLNVGQISRSVRGLPDDFNGDKMIYENNMKKNITVGADFNLFAAGFGLGEEAAGEAVSQTLGRTSLGVKYNNYDGFGFSLSNGLNYQISENLSVGINMTASASEGTSISPSISLDHKYKDSKGKENSLTGNLGTTLNSRKGITNLTMSASRSKKDDKLRKQFKKNKDTEGKNIYGTNTSGNGGSISFLDASYTPTKRVGMESSNFTFSLNIEGEIWGFEPGAKFAGYRTSQGIRESEKYKEEKAYGFENSFAATKEDVLDFNREKDRTFNQYSTTLPITNNTYDIYSIQGQGISGMFRPYKSQVGHVFDNYTKDISNGGSLGLEFGGGGGVHWGFDGEVTPSNGKTAVWEEQNNALPKFRESTSGNNPDYEKVFFKNIGGFHVDQELDLLGVEGSGNSSLGGYDPIKIGVTGGEFARTAQPKYLKKKYNYTGGSTEQVSYDDIPVNNAIKRTERLKRNQVIQKLTRAEAAKYGFNTKFSPYSISGKHDDHTSEIRILKNDGARYIYGQTAYNVVKKEVTFDVSGRLGDCKTGLVNYSPGSDNTPNNNRSGDQYFNRITTPSYAHTYLLTSVLSSDYEDLTGDGPSDDDLGAYTKFTYENKNDDLYKWRVPYDKNKANFNEGIRSSAKDNKGNYIYGEKELVYVSEIETKTHIAKFHLSPRRDALGVLDENGGGNSSSEKMWKLDKIALYAKPEYEANGDDAEPIKQAHFVYDYSLCKNVKNNFGGLTSESSYPYSQELSNDKGKLTLKKVYFTYRDSNMGEYTPYSFNYEKDLDGDGTIDNNPDYDQKGYDIWGNYLPTSDSAGCSVDNDLTNAEYPYVDQSNPDNQQDIYANAWSLTSIDLPSGGNIEMEYESNDYNYVQDKDVMSMFKVVGAGNVPLSQSNSSQLSNDLLYKVVSQDASHLYIKLNESISSNPDLPTEQDKIDYFRNNYIRNLVNETVYFRFLLNMDKPGGKTSNWERDDFDYVTGYLELDGNDFGLFEQGETQYASIPIQSVNKGDGLNDSDQVNPIAKAGWNFGKKYLNRKVYSISNEENTNDLEGVVMEIIGAVPAIFDIFRSPNGKLRERNIARRFIPEKSWIRLMHPNDKKLGGGCRVKSLRMNDEWDTMTNNDGNELYKQFYGQEYNYETEEGISSGVATYEPLGGKENPFVQPFFDRDNPGLLLGPDESNYVEKPLGESFFPSPTITYSKVTVKNLDRERTEGEDVLVVKKHATGYVVNEFFTSYDYPTIVDNTDLTTFYDKSDVLSSLLNLRVRDNLTLSQGYSIHTNDMNGKMRRQRVYAEGQSQYISGVDYNYEVLSGQEANNRNQGKLNNVITTIDSDGHIREKLVGVDYDVINDFRDTKTVTETYGVKFNTAGLPLFLIFIIVPVPIPKYSRHESQIKMAVTTKVIHSSGIMREKVAYDVGSKVTTKNLAWDASTGNVLLTKTINEYGDYYYNFNYPAFWSYDGMGLAADNIGVEWGVTSTGGNKYQLQGSNATDYLLEGDELWLQSESSGLKAWIVDIDDSGFTIINEDGLRITSEEFDSGDLKVIRSGRRNLQSASMASVTSMVNPIEGITTINNDTFLTDSSLQYRIVNASAVEYEDTWAAECECNLPRMQYDDNGKLVFDYQNETEAYNPYRYNIRGNWRAKRSFAYLTGRNFTDDPTPRKTGFFTDFRPLYKYNSSDSNWYLDHDLISEGTIGEPKHWTFASEVSKYNPYGQEVENMDALERYSSALYGFNNRLPVAVASNTKYKELGYDGFEDYDFVVCDSTAHFSFQKNTLQNTISVSDEEAHTGRKSLRVAPNNSAVISKQIIDCDDIDDGNNGGSGDRNTNEYKASKGN